MGVLQLPNVAGDMRLPLASLVRTKICKQSIGYSHVRKQAIASTGDRGVKPIYTSIIRLKRVGGIDSNCSRGLKGPPEPEPASADWHQGSAPCGSSSALAYSPGAPSYSAVALSMLFRALPGAPDAPSRAPIKAASLPFLNENGNRERPVRGI